MKYFTYLLNKKIVIQKFIYIILFINKYLHVMKRAWFKFHKKKIIRNMKQGMDKNMENELLHRYFLTKWFFRICGKTGTWHNCKYCSLPTKINVCLQHQIRIIKKQIKKNYSIQRHLLMKKIQKTIFICEL